MHVSEQLRERARADTETVLRELESRLDGLSQAEADARLRQFGLNEIAREKRQSPLMRLLDNVKNPLVLLLTALGVLSYLTGEGDNNGRVCERGGATVLGHGFLRGLPRLACVPEERFGFCPQEVTFRDEPLRSDVGRPRRCLRPQLSSLAQAASGHGR